MVIENLLQHEILEINRRIIKKRVPLIKLLENPNIEDEKRVIRVSQKCLEELTKRCNLPAEDILLPITFFIPAGSYEGYLISKKDCEVVSSLGFDMHERNGRFWLAKYKIRKLEGMCPGLFQSVIVP